MTPVPNLEKSPLTITPGTTVAREVVVPVGSGEVARRSKFRPESSVTRPGVFLSFWDHDKSISHRILALETGWSRPGIDFHRKNHENPSKTINFALPATEGKQWAK